MRPFSVHRQKPKAPVSSADPGDSAFREGDRSRQSGKADEGYAIEMKEIESGLDGVIVPPSEAGVPKHVWDLLQKAGEAAAFRLNEILQSPKFAKYPPTAQKALIELALTRAYGLPVRKAVTVMLSSSDSDAVAKSLSELTSALPEMRARDITPDQ